MLSARDFHIGASTRRTGLAAVGSMIMFQPLTGGRGQGVGGRRIACNLTRVV
jgi:hypothetical protein